MLTEPIHSSSAGEGSTVLLWFYFPDGNAETLALKKMWFGLLWAFAMDLCRISVEEYVECC